MAVGATKPTNSSGQLGSRWALPASQEHSLEFSSREKSVSMPPCGHVSGACFTVLSWRLSGFVTEGPSKVGFG